MKFGIKVKEIKARKMNISKFDVKKGNKWIDELKNIFVTLNKMLKEMKETPVYNIEQLYAHAEAVKALRSAWDELDRVKLFTEYILLNEKLVDDKEGVKNEQQDE